MHLGGSAMGLIKYKLGDLIELVLDTNSDLKYGSYDVRGMTITKEIIPTKADVAETDLSRFLVVNPGEFIYNPRTHGKRIGFGYNNTDNTFLISWNNIAFRVKPSMIGEVSADYLFMHFKRDEWDREACFQSWGSSTEVFSWDTLCDMDINLPPLPIQQKYVDVYNAMLANQQSYERGLEDLKLSCYASVENLKKDIQKTKIGDLIELITEANSEMLYGSEDVKGMTITKEIISTKADVKETDLSRFLVVHPREFIYNPRTHGKRIGFGYNNTDSTFIISWNNIAFKVKSSKKNVVLADYLFLHFARDEWDREACFRSWGSSTEVFSWDTLCDMKINLPSISIQQSIANIYNSYMERKKINERLKSQLKDICPILIKGSIEEAKK